MRKPIRFGIVGAVVAIACSGDPSGPSRPEIAGTYTLTELRFDPQGSLPEVDILSRLGAANVPRLVLAPLGDAQLVFEDPATGLLTIVSGRYSTPSEGARIDFGTNTAYNRVLLSRRMVLAFSPPGTLTFDGESPDGVDRQRLLHLVPEWSDEQLLDPVPGRLVIVFERSGP